MHHTEKMSEFHKEIEVSGRRVRNTDALRLYLKRVP